MSRSPISEIPQRYFTVAEANALLPTLERELHRLHRLYRLAKDRYIEMKQIRAVGIDQNGVALMAYDYKLACREFEQLVSQINDSIASINNLGCQLKHVELGLVDFPTRLNNETVLLCWRLGEPSVNHYHGQEDGYAGRRPLHWL